MRTAAVVVGVLAAVGCTPSPTSADARAEALSDACLEREEATCLEAAKHYEAMPPNQRVNKRLAALYYRACIRGESEACDLAAKLYEKGNVRAPRGKRAHAMFEHVCESRFPYEPEACTAAALFGRACEGGLGRSCAELAMLHQSGRLGRRRPELSQMLRSKACSEGHSESCAFVARDLAAADPGRAAKLLETGCEAGDMDQCVALADFLERGVGLRRDLPRARALRKKACDQDKGEACRALARMWHKGMGGERSIVSAAALYTRGCDLSDADSCLALAEAHGSGAFGEGDMAQHYELSAKAAGLYGPACERGDAHACATLGALHRKGGGVREDRTLGLELQRRACALGWGAGCIGWLSRGPHRIGIAEHPALARAISSACERGDGGACFAAGWIGVADLQAAGAKPPAHPFMRGCRAGDAASCNALGVARFPPAAVAVEALVSACALGYAPGCHHLGVAEEMRGEVESDERAVAAYARGCSLKWAASCTRLGMMRRQGHVTPGASSARTSLKKGCDGGDADGCYELGLTLREQSGANEVGMRLLTTACDRGHVPSCGELGRRALNGGPDQRAGGRTQLSQACAGGSARACLVLAGDSDHPVAERPKLIDRAVELSKAACGAGLAVCIESESRPSSLAWQRYDGAPARVFESPPRCGVSLERSCVVQRDALVARCELEAAPATACFEGAEQVRRLAKTGMSIGASDAAKMDFRGVTLAKKACRKRDAKACAALANAYEKGRGAKLDPRQATRYRKRACELDKALCVEN